jgi:NAD(P)-dependent dehydrogenase (short-subunit alcohol dehydrogenase family)
MTNTRELSGKRALVTGASQGLGVEIVHALADAGVDLVLSARSAVALERLAAEVADKHGTRVVPLPADLAAAADVERLADAAWDALGGLDILVNNAGISIPQSVVDLTVQAWDDTMAVNLRAPALLGSRIGAAMARAGRGGKIINISSAAGITALAEHYAYSVSKAALAMATRMLALELGPAGIQTNTLSPTVVMTEMGQRVWGEQAKAAPMLARIPLGHFAQPSDVAGAVLFLASAAADMINGVDLPIDGGYSAV